MHDRLPQGCTDADVERSQSVGECPRCVRNETRRSLISVLEGRGVKADLFQCEIEAMASDAEDAAAKQDVWWCREHDRHVRVED